jgi:hypothetical protein
MSKKLTFEQLHPDLDKVRVDFLNLPLIGAEGKPLVFLTQRRRTRRKKQEDTLVFTLDVAIKTFSGIARKLREYKRTNAGSNTIRG